MLVDDEPAEQGIREASELMDQPRNSARAADRRRLPRPDAAWRQEPGFGRRRRLARSARRVDGTHGLPAGHLLHAGMSFTLTRARDKGEQHESIDSGPGRRHRRLRRQLDLSVAAARRGAGTGRAGRRSPPRTLNARIAELEKARNELAQRRVARSAGICQRESRIWRIGRVAAACRRPWRRRPASPNRPSGRCSATGTARPRCKKMMRTRCAPVTSASMPTSATKLGLNKDSHQQAHRPAHRPAGRGHEFRHAAVIDPAEARAAPNRRRARTQTDIADLLGPDKAAALEEYQEIMPARMELEMLARQLEGDEAPLSDDQRKRMLAALVEERERVPMPQMSDDATTGRIREGRMRPGRTTTTKRVSVAGAQHSQLRAAHRLQRIPAVAEGNARADSPRVQPRRAAVASRQCHVRDAAPVAAPCGRDGRCDGRRRRRAKSRRRVAVGGA